MKHPVIALLTDFGDEDFFVASLKGVMLGINPLARIVDITHKVPSHNIGAAGFVLFAAYKYFPSDTIFLTIVDPGVGTNRRVLLVKTRDYYFIAPDNGILSLVLKEERIDALREITAQRYFLADVSPTFEGRDRMAPVAAWLSKGEPYEKFGPKTTLYEKTTVFEPRLEDGQILGRILYVDKFGNLITNIPERMIGEYAKRKDSSFILDPYEVKIIYGDNYSSVKKGDLLVLKGSLGLLEVAVREGSAAQRLRMKPGDPMNIRFGKHRKKI